MSVLPQLTWLKERALDFLFPRWCVGCGREGSFICSSCLRRLIPITPPVCPHCGRPQENSFLCPDCQNRQAGIDGICASFRFEGVAREAIHQLKYRSLKALAPELAKLMAGYLEDYPIPGNILVPVPMHPRRLRERGYNQSGLLARELGKLTGITVNEDSLIRHRYGNPQARAQNVMERRVNVADTFRCCNLHLSGRRVILIDDVATSGATLDSCAEALKKVGALSVWGLTFAREI